MKKIVIIITTILAFISIIFVYNKYKQLHTYNEEFSINEINIKLDDIDTEIINKINEKNLKLENNKENIRMLDLWKKQLEIVTKNL